MRTGKYKTQKPTAKHQGFQKFLRWFHFFRIKIFLNSSYLASDFWALFYNLKPIENKPDWYPKDPHISFLYQYNEPITSIHVNHLKQYLVPYKSNLKQIALNNSKVNLSPGQRPPGDTKSQQICLNKQQKTMNINPNKL